MNGHKLRIEIRRDGYKFQSWARLERWDGDKWRELATIPYGAMQTPDAQYGRRWRIAENSGQWLELADYFADDRNRMIEQARLILED